MQSIILGLAVISYLLATGLPSRYRPAISITVVVGWLAHALSMASEIDAHGAFRVGFAVMLSVTLWISVAAYWLENRNLELDSLRVLVLPCAAVAAVLPAIFPGQLALLEGRSPLFSWHVAIAILAYSTLTIAAFHALLMALQESRLHTRNGAAQPGWFGATIDRLPALLTMEKLLFRLVAFGFVLLTLTVVSGLVFSEQLFGKAFKLEHKTVFTLMSWVLFGALLAGRKWRGWRGKTALRYFLFGFIALLLGYVGSHFVYEVILGRKFI
ncbi:MAG TPA: cytochrome c biogenesis protein CcsA [Burkholderiaceae bacterium]|jgi:ABC-type uncharacterized transport system permease subunit